MALRPSLPSVGRPSKRELEKIKPTKVGEETEEDDSVPNPSLSREDLMRKLEMVERKQKELEDRERRLEIEQEEVKGGVDEEPTNIEESEKVTKVEDDEVLQQTILRQQYFEYVEEKLFEIMSILKKLKKE